MFSTNLEVDRKASDREVISALASAFDAGATQVAIVDLVDYQAVGDRWEDPSVRILIRRSVMPGDFPLALQISTKADPPSDLLTVVKAIARELGASIITDEIEAQYDDDWLLVAPSGATALVTADLDELDGDEPAIVLVPESRAIYEALVHRPLAATR